LRSNIAPRGTGLRERVAAYWSGPGGEDPVFQTEAGRRYVFFDHVLGDSSRIGIFVGDDQFTLNPVMKGILLASVFLTVFLVLFLILSLRQDASFVLAERIKKLQINMLREYFERKDDIDWQKWRAELEIRRDDVRQELKRGLGKIKKKDGEKLDQLVDKSWDEIIAVLTSRGAEKKTSMELEKLEGMIEKVVANLQAVPKERVRPGKKAGAAEKVPAYAQKAGEVEEAAGAEAVEEAETLEEAESVEALEEAEAVEEAGEVEELAEAVEAESAEEPALAEAVEEIEEAEEAESAEEAEAAAEVPEAEEEAPEAEVVEAESAGEPAVAEAVIEEAEEAESAEESALAAAALEVPEAVEETPEAEAVEAESAGEPAVAEAETVEEAGEAESAEESALAAAAAEDLEELEELEELEDLEEIEQETSPEQVEEEAEDLDETGAAALEETSSRTAIFSANTYASLKAVQQGGPPVLSGKGVYDVRQLAKAGKFVFIPLNFTAAEEPVVAREAKKEVPAQTEPPLTTARSKWGIDDLFSDLDIDLQQIVSEEESADTSRRTRTAEGQEPKTLMTPDGFFQYDRFLKSFRADDTGVTKSLMSISRAFPSSFFSALLCVEGENLAMKYYIGLQDDAARNCRMPLISQMAEGMREPGKAIVVQWPIKKIDEFKELLLEMDLTSEFFPLFIPVVWKKSTSYLFLCVSEVPAADGLLGTLKGIKPSRSMFSF
jgi:hypothetical protein